MSKSIFVLRVLRGRATTECLLAVYFSLVQSHIDYGILFWGNDAYAEKIFILQKRAVRIISNVTQRTHCKPLFSKLQILTLPSLYVMSCLMYIKSNEASFVNHTAKHNYPTRNRFDLVLDRNQYSRSNKSFEHMSRKIFNALPLSTRELPIKRFKMVIKNALVEASIYKVDEFFSIAQSIVT